MLLRMGGQEKWKDTAQNRVQILLQEDCKFGDLIYSTITLEQHIIHLKYDESRIIVFSYKKVSI